MARLPKGMRRRVDGTLEYRITYEGQRPGVYGKTVKECQGKMLKKIQAIKEHAYIRNSNITLDKYFEEWIEQKANSVSGNSIRSYKSLYYSRISPVLGKRKVKNIERREVMRLQNRIYKDCTRNATNTTMNILHQLMKAAELDGIVTRNVCANVKGVKDKEMDKAARDTIHRALTDKEIDIFFKYAKPSWYYNVYRLMLATGMRAGEVCGLEWRDIDMAKKVIHVRRTTTTNANGKSKVGDTTKTRKSKRDIPMNASMMAILEDMRIAHAELYGNKIQRIDGLLVHTEKGTVANAVNVTNAMKAILRRAAKNGEPLGNVTSHALRATFASKAIEQGTQPNTLKEIMGHASLAMTMDLYGHTYEEQKRQAMENIHIIGL